MEREACARVCKRVLGLCMVCEAAQRGMWRVPGVGGLTTRLSLSSDLGWIFTFPGGGAVAPSPTLLFVHRAQSGRGP